MGVWAIRNDAKDEIKTIKEYLEFSKPIFLISSKKTVYNSSPFWQDTFFSFPLTIMFDKYSSISLRTIIQFGNHSNIGNVFFRWKIKNVQSGKLYHPSVSRQVDDSKLKRLKTGFGISTNNNMETVSSISNEAIFTHEDTDSKRFDMILQIYITDAARIRFNSSWANTNDEKYSFTTSSVRIQELKRVIWGVLPNYVLYQ